MVAAQTKRKQAAVVLCEMAAVSAENKNLFPLLQEEKGLLESSYHFTARV